MVAHDGAIHPDRGRPPAATTIDTRPNGKAKYLRALIPPQALGQVNAELNKSGVPFDLTRLKPEQLEALVEHLDEMTVEVDAPDAKVRVFCE